MFFYFLLDNSFKIRSNKTEKEYTMQGNKEIAVGIFMTIVLVMLLTFVHNRSVHEQAGNRFTLNATFTKADGLMSGGEVRLAGIKVGQIGQQSLAANGYQVVVQMVFDRPMDIPVDSSVRIETDGIMGTKHIEILPGGEEDNMQSGEMFGYAQDALILGELLDKVNAFMREKKQTAANESARQQEAIP